VQEAGGAAAVSVSALRELVWVYLRILGQEKYRFLRRIRYLS
jgi:hypothetical protein